MCKSRCIATDDLVAWCVSLFRGCAAQKRLKGSTELWTVKRVVNVSTFPANDAVVTRHVVTSHHLRLATVSTTRKSYAPKTQLRSVMVAVTSASSLVEILSTTTRQETCRVDTPDSASSRQPQPRSAEERHALSKDFTVLPYLHTTRLSTTE